MRLTWPALILTGFLILAAVSHGVASDPEDFWLPNWPYRRAVTITNPGTSDLVEQTVLINLSTTPFSHVQANGADIRVYDSVGNPIPFWVEVWVGNDADDPKLLWVKVPFIPAGESTTVYIYYGNPAATSAGDPNSVFLFYDSLDSLDNWNFYELCWSDTEGYYVTCDSPGYFSLSSDYFSPSHSMEAGKEYYDSSQDYYLYANITIGVVEPGLYGLAFWAKTDDSGEQCSWTACDSVEVGLTLRDWTNEGDETYVTLISIGMDPLLNTGEKFYDPKDWTRFDAQLQATAEDTLTVYYQNSPWSDFTMPKKLFLDEIMVWKKAYPDPGVVVGSEEFNPQAVGALVQDVKVNGMTNPRVYDAEVVFSWSYYGVTPQESYQVWVGTCEGCSDVWDSGEITSPVPSAVYLGPPLARGQKYYVCIRAKSEAQIWSDWTCAYFIYRPPAPGPAPTIAPLQPKESQNETPSSVIIVPPPSGEKAAAIAMTTAATLAAVALVIKRWRSP